MGPSGCSRCPVYRMKNLTELLPPLNVERHDVKCVEQVQITGEFNKMATPRAETAVDILL